MASATLQDTRVYPATSAVAAALAFENAELRVRMRREARAAALLEMAVDGLDLSGFSPQAIEDAIEAGEADLASDPADHRAVALERAVAELRTLLDDDGAFVLPIAA